MLGGRGNSKRRKVNGHQPKQKLVLCTDHSSVGSRIRNAASMSREQTSNMRAPATWVCVLSSLCVQRTVGIQSWQICGSCLCLHFHSSHSHVIRIVGSSLPQVQHGFTAMVSTSVYPKRPLFVGIFILTVFLFTILCMFILRAGYSHLRSPSHSWALSS